MSNWDSVSKSIGSIIDERLSSPLVSSFVISWSIINYKFFVLLFSKTPAIQTFDLIQRECFPTWEAKLLYGALYPAITTAIYLFALPYPSRWVYRKWREAQKKVDDIKEEFDREQRLTLEDSQTLRRKNNDLEGSLDAKNEELRILKNDLRAASAKIENLDELEKIHAQLRESNNELTKERTELSIKNTALKGHLDKVTTENAALKSTNDELAAAKASLLKDVKALEDFRNRYNELQIKLATRGDGIKKAENELARLINANPAMPTNELVARLNSIEDVPKNRLLEMLEQAAGVESKVAGNGATPPTGPMSTLVQNLPKKQNTVRRTNPVSVKTVIVPRGDSGTKK